MIKIMVDSSSDCKAEDNIYDIFVPITINIGGEEFKDGVDINADKFYDILTNGNDFPRTSQPSPQEFLEIFETAKQNKDTIIYFALSSALSGTYQGALIAKEMADYDNIFIIDTKTASHMIGVLARYAKQLIEKGVSAEEIVNKCEELKSKVKVLAGLDTLEYLKKGGRLSSTSAMIGTLANIKPIITVNQNGQVDTIGKALGVGKAIQYITEKLSSVEIDQNFPIYLLYTKGKENSLKLAQKLNLDIKDTLQVGATIGAHVGPEIYGILYVIK